MQILLMTVLGCGTNDAADSSEADTDTDTDTDVDTDTDTDTDVDTDTDTDTDVDTYPGQGIAWDKKTPKEREAYMEFLVEPTMEAAFQKHDALKFAKFDCTTCHGSGANSGKFELPNAELPKLDRQDWPQGSTADFMDDVVVPTLIDLLDAEPFDRKTGEGLGCFSCHTPK